MTKETQTPGGYALLDFPVTKDFLQECMEQEILFDKQASDKMRQLAVESAKHHQAMAQSSFHNGIGYTDPEWLSSDLSRLTLDNLASIEWVLTEQQRRETYFTNDDKEKKKNLFFEIEFDLASDLLIELEDSFDHTEVITNYVERSATNHVYGAVQVGVTSGERHAIVTLLGWPAIKNNEMKYRCTVDVFTEGKLSYSWEVCPYRLFDEASAKDFNSKAGFIGFTNFLCKAAWSAYACFEQLGKNKTLRVFEPVFDIHRSEHFNVNWKNCFDSRSMQEVIKYFYVAPFYSPGEYAGVSIEYIAYPKLELSRLGIRQKTNIEFGATPHKLAEEAKLILVETHLETNNLVMVAGMSAPRVFARTEYFSGLDFDEPLEEGCESMEMSSAHIPSPKDYEEIVGSCIFVTYSALMDIAAELSIN